MEIHSLLTLTRPLLLTSLLATSAFGQEGPDPAGAENPAQATPVVATREPGTTPEAAPDHAGAGERTAKPKGAKQKKKKKKEKKETAAKRPIEPADYAQWEQLNTDPDLFSDDGQWLVYTIQRIDESKTLHLHRVKGNKTAEIETYQQGERPVFSNDSQWLAVTIGKSPAEAKKEREAGSNPPPSAGSRIQLRHLGSNETTKFEQVGDLSFSDDSRFAAIEVLGKPAAAKPGTPPAAGGAAPGKALLIRTLATGADTTFGNVVKHAWSESGSLLAMVIDSPSISNSLQLFDPARGALRTLETSDQEYVTLAWRKDSTDLAAMREMKHGEKEDASHVLLLWRGLEQEETERYSYDHAGLASFPAGARIVPGLSWSKDGAALFCDVQEWDTMPKDFPKPPEKKSKKKRGKKKSAPADSKEDAKEKADSGAKPDSKEQPADPAAPEGGTEKKGPTEKSAEEGKAEPKTLRERLKTPSEVEVWHSKDVDIMPLQKKKANALKNPKRRAVWWPERDKFVQLANDLTEEVRILGNGRQVVGSDGTPHERTAMFGPQLEDLYLINALTGKRERILEGVKFTLAPSPNGRYLLYLHDEHVWSHDVKTGKQRRLCEEPDAHFTDQEDDTLAVEKRPFGPGYWLKDSSAVILYDRFDMWLVAPDGSRAVKLTDGAGDMIQHRLSRTSLDPDDGTIDPARPLYVGLYGERTKKSGYGRLTLGAEGRKPGDFEVLLWDDLMIANLSRARDHDAYALTMERADKSRNLYVAGSDLSRARPVTDTNPFQKKFLWGRSELVDYESRDGVKLQGALTYPAGYKPGRQYPMIVYIYEKRSQELHRYIPPSEKHPYNPTVFSAEGYFVFQPDIVYRPQEPGLSALDCVVPAVEKVIATGLVDSKRIGLMGHSWGAYQTSFIVTRCDLFAAGVAGAPLTDMMSMSVSVYWNSGQTNAAIFTQSQGRMDKPFWRDVENYVANSPIHGLDTLHTPLLIAFGDKDGAVDWGQGIQMYNAARWAGKDDLVMLIYPGENHGLRKEENMVDYHYRVREWFAQYLKGDESKKWITEGTSFLEREKEKEALKKNEKK